MDKRRNTASEEEDETSPLFLCAHLILPWLPPLESAAVSSTCKTLNRISNSIAAARAADAARGLEPLPIPFLNAVDNHRYAYFIYTRTQILGTHPSRARQPWGSQTRPDSAELTRSGAGLTRSGAVSAPVIGDVNGGCGCERCGEESGCPCFGDYSAELTRECGPSCGCLVDYCGNRMTQGGVSAQVKIVRDGKKGWGLSAGEVIREGQFVCEYAGELLTTEEARKRHQRYDQLASDGKSSSALLVVREHLPSGKACLRINIDATVVGNVARFINHSCDGGNLSTVLVRSSGSLLPRLCMFASRDIQETEELAFSYGETRLNPKGSPCFCGASCCLGVMPSEST